MGVLSGSGTGILADDEALAFFLDANKPRKQPKPPAKPYRAPQTAPGGGRQNKVKQNHRLTRSAQTKTRNIEEFDEEMVRTRRYWEKWASQASKDLLKNIYDDMGNGKPTKELVYSGRCGAELKYKNKLEDSDSEGTVISLLSTSTLDDSGKYVRKKKRKSVRVVEKTDWEKLAKERANKGALDKLIRRDASRMERYMKGRHAPIQNVVQQTKASDLMEQMDQTLIRYTAYTRGLSGIGKSHSTENVLSAVHGHPRPISRSSSSILNRSITDRSDRATPRPSLSGRGITPTPAAISAAYNRETRPESAAVTAFDHDLQCDERYRLIPQKGPTSNSHLSPFSADQDVPDLPTNHLASERVDEDRVKGAFLRRVHKRMHATVKALDRNIGYGDTTDVMKTPDGDKGRYTAADYARIPRYPQNIRIAPQLGRVIRSDIREKMGKPRQKVIREKDLKQFDIENSRLGRSFRNMVIFNWLNELERADYMNDASLNPAPEIYDIEGANRFHNRLPQFGDVTDVLSNITTRPSSAYTSLYSGRVSDNEESEEEADEDEFSMATGSAGGVSSTGNT